MQQQTIQSAGNAGSAGKEFNYPVEVADGRRLTISWNRGENPQAEPGELSGVLGLWRRKLSRFHKI